MSTQPAGGGFASLGVWRGGAGFSSHLYRFFSFPVSFVSIPLPHGLEFYLMEFCRGLKASQAVLLSSPGAGRLTGQGASSTYTYTTDYNSSRKMKNGCHSLNMSFHCEQPLSGTDGTA